jgi:cytochrome d ubiquinol oxidase subunit II
MLVLFSLIVRGVAFEFRARVESARWRRFWDACMTVGSWIPVLLFGVAFGNLFRGIPIGPGGAYEGDLLALLNPYALVSGATFCAMFLWHGALWLAHKTEGELHARAANAARRLWALLVIFGVLFVIASIMETQLAANYFVGLPNLLLLAVPAAAVLALITNRVFIAFGQWFKAWQASGLTLFAVLFTCLIGAYPRMIPSLISPYHSLTAFNAASGPATLNIMFVIAVVMVPIILLYQRWAYGVFGEKVSQQEDELYY